MADGLEGFYATVRRGTQTGLLLGPYPSKDQADANVAEGRRLAYRVDPRTHFDVFGVTRVVMRPGCSLPIGKLNHLAGTPDTSRIQSYHHEVPR